MNYFSEQIIESFKVMDEKQIENNLSIITVLKLADKIVMHRWLYNMCEKHRDRYRSLSLYLSDNIIYDQYKKPFIHSLLIVHESKPKGLYIHRLLLLSHNRIALISKCEKDYLIEIYSLFKVDYRYENEETLQWLKYKIAYENAPVLFENEINYFQIQIS